MRKLEKSMKSTMKCMYEYQEELKKENAELKAQIEKMKNCGNCKHLGIVYDEETETIQNCIYQEECEHHEKWELAE